MSTRTNPAYKHDWHEEITVQNPAVALKKAEVGLDLGWLPPLSLTGALGLLLVAVAFTNARSTVPWSETLFWVGLVVIYVPVAFRLLQAQITRREVIGLLVLLGMLLYLVKVLHSPANFTFNDEFIHWRTTYDITRTGQLFTQNPILPVSSLYPGLEIVASALVTTTGLSFFSTGLLLIGVARLLFVLALFLIYEAVSGSYRVAGIATLVYLANPNFIFFSAQFSYESLAIPLLSLTVLAIIRVNGARNNTFAPFIIGLIGLAAVIVTHHVTSFALMAFLLLWSIVNFVRNKARRVKLSPTLFALLAVVGCVGWVLTVAQITLNYLGPILDAAVNEFSRLVFNQGNGAKVGRALFESPSGQVAPLWEEIVALSSVGLITICLPLGAYLVWRNHRQSSLAVAIALSALMYPVSLAFRFTTSGWEASNRSSEFLYMGNAFLIGLLVVEFNWSALFSRFKRKAVSAIPKNRAFFSAPFLAACAGILLVGGVIAGWPPSSRLPGSYLPDAGTRSVDQKGISAAVWSRNYLGPNQVIGTDKIQMLLQGTYGAEWPSNTTSGGVNALWILYAPELKSDQIDELKEGGIKYLVIDHRLGQNPNLSKPYYPFTITAVTLAKFDKIPGFSRIFDDGDIAIYKVGGLAGVR